MRIFIYQKWWKVLAIGLLLYTFIAGFKVPLQPGILSVTPDFVTAGQNIRIDISSYNTTDQLLGSGTKVYIKLDSNRVFQAHEVQKLDRKTITVKVDIPQFAEDRVQASVIAILEDGGYMILPSALVIQNSDAYVTTNTNWPNIDIKSAEWKFQFPFRAILYETIRNTFFHVAIWFAMFILMTISLIYSIRYLMKAKMVDDAGAFSFASVAVVFGMMGMITGSIWAKNTWGAYWTNDPKLNMAAIAMMIYLAYLILRSSIENEEQRAKIAAAYNIFSFAAMIPLVFIIPRLTSSLHPGNGGNPALGGEDMDNTLRLVFYPAIIGLALLGVWISSILFRMKKIQLQLYAKSLDL